jgi:hypothetical protein
MITQSDQLRARRQDLADKMQRIQELMDDKMLLSLLRNISGGFSGNDCLEYVSVNAHAIKNPAENKDGDANLYTVRIHGITKDSASLAELMTRLGQQSSPAMNVVLESSHRRSVVDGQVMSFEILCEKPSNKGT